MWRNVVGPTLALLANGYTFTTSLYIAAWWEPGRKEIEEGGFDWVVFFFFPMFFTVPALVSALRPTRGGKYGLAACTFLLALFCFATLFTIGPFFVPGLALLFIAAVSHAWLARRPVGVGR